MNSLESELIRMNTTQVPASNQEQLHFETSFSKNNEKPILDLSFLEPHEETKADKARHILGENANSIPTEQLETFIAQIEFLTNSWLDSYEKQLFDGKTLKELTKLY